MTRKPNVENNRTASAPAAYVPRAKQDRLRGCLSGSLSGCSVFHRTVPQYFPPGRRGGDGSALAKACRAQVWCFEEQRKPSFWTIWSPCLGKAALQKTMDHHTIHTMGMTLDDPLERSLAFSKCAGFVD